MPRKKKAPPKERLYTIDEMCTLLQVERRTLVEWVQFHRIPFIKVDGRIIRFKLSDIARWVKDKNKEKEKFSLT